MSSKERMEDIKHPKMYILVKILGGFNFLFFLYLLLGVFAEILGWTGGNKTIVHRLFSSTPLTYADKAFLFCIALWLSWYLLYRFLLKKTLH